GEGVQGLRGAQQPGLLRRVDGDQYADDDPGEGGVHPALEDGGPQRDAEDDVGGDAADPQFAQRRDEREQHHRGAQRGQRQVGGVEQRDDGDGQDVVGDGQGQQEHPERGGAAGTDDRDQAEGERGVGADRDAPAHGAGPARVERQVDQGGADHAADGGADRDHDDAPFAQFAEGEFAGQLQADGEEEQHHQAVVDPLVQGEGEGRAADVQADRGLPEVLVAVAPG